MNLAEKIKRLCWQSYKHGQHDLDKLKFETWLDEELRVVYEPR